MRIIIFCSLFISIPFGLPVQALPDFVLVDLFQAKPSVSHITVSGALELVKPQSRMLPGSRFIVRSCGAGVELVPTPTASLRLPNRGTAYGASALVQGRVLVLRGRSGMVKLTHPAAAARSYRGEVLISKAGDGNLRIVNRVSSHDYVVSAVGSETNPNFPKEELRAQAVLAQTLLARYKPGDKLADTTEREAYLGTAYERPEVKDAVSAVWHQELTYHGRPIYPYFHSTCAGGTSDGAAYFHLQPPHDFPYLASRACSYCHESPFWGVKKSRIPKEIYERKFAPGTPVVLSTDKQHRPLQVSRAIGRSTGAESVNGFTYWTELGQKLGWDKVPGTRYSVHRDADGSIVFQSTGAGHGVGMCQWGASEMARQGKKYLEILSYYFPGTKIEHCK